MQLAKTVKNCVGSFGQFWAIVCNSHASFRHSAFSVSQSDDAVLAHYYAYIRSPVSCKPGHVVGHGAKGAKVVC